MTTRPRSGRGAKTAERGPTTASTSPRRARSHSAARSPSDRPLCRRETRSPKRATSRLTRAGARAISGTSRMPRRPDATASSRAARYTSVLPLPVTPSRRNSREPRAATDAPIAAIAVALRRRRDRAAIRARGPDVPREVHAALRLDGVRRARPSRARRGRPGFRRRREVPPETPDARGPRGGRAGRGAWASARTPGGRRRAGRAIHARSEGAAAARRCSERMRARPRPTRSLRAAARPLRPTASTRSGSRASPRSRRSARTSPAVPATEAPTAA